MIDSEMRAMLTFGVTVWLAKMARGSDTEYEEACNGRRMLVDLLNTSYDEEHGAATDDVTDGSRSMAQDDGANASLVFKEDDSAIANASTSQTPIACGCCISVIVCGGRVVKVTGARSDGWCDDVYPPLPTIHPMTFKKY